MALAVWSRAADLEEAVNCKRKKKSLVRRPLYQSIIASCSCPFSALKNRGGQREGSGE